jgi:AcrR family transcriptional regulator
VSSHIVQNRSMSNTAGPGRGREALLAAARAELQESGYASITLRAVARRAGVSHAAPKYFFTDRAGMLTAIATEGFQALAARLRDVIASGPAQPLAALGHAYVTFGLERQALFDLMFRPIELNPADPDLQAAQSDAIGLLGAAMTESVGHASPAGREHPSLSLVSWALAHGLVALTRDGALKRATAAPDQQATTAIARSLIDLFVLKISGE